MTDCVIKTTARLQATEEPARQRPIIRIEPGRREELMAQLDYASQLAASIRASIDSGRDNPFRPDGEIYKLTNPIVDYYKYGPNQSRTGTPSYAELQDEPGPDAKGAKADGGRLARLLGGASKSKRAAEGKREWKKATNGVAPASDAAAAAGAGAGAANAHEQRPTRRPCWRRWLCCCCCCCGRSDAKSSADLAAASTNGGSHVAVAAQEKANSRADGTRVARAPKATEGKAAATSNDLTQKRTEDCCASGHGDSTGAQHGRAPGNSRLIGNGNSGGGKRQAKVVLVEGHESLDGGPESKSKGRQRTGKREEVARDSAERQSGPAQPTTRVKTTSRCVIS